MEFDIVVQMRGRPRPLSGTVRSQLHAAALEIERPERRRELFQRKPVRDFEELGFGKHVPLRVDYRNAVIPRFFEHREIPFPYKLVRVGAWPLLSHRGTKYAFPVFGKNLEPRLHPLQGIIRHVACKQKHLRPLGGIADMVVADAENHALILVFCATKSPLRTTDSVYTEKQR